MPRRRLQRDDIARRQAAWSDRVTGLLPVLLERLLDSEVYGQDGVRPLPPESYGVYLFSEGGEPRYTGRVGLTERSRRAGKRFSSFRTRLNGHLQPRHSSGTYAYERTCRVFRERHLILGTRNENCANAEFMAEFRRQCECVRRMDFRVVEINDDVVAAVFEIYTATVLDLPQSFAVS